MAGRKIAKTAVVQIDADWLLGEPDVRPIRNGSWFVRLVVSLGIVGTVVWAWPHASKAWLQWDWQSQLAQSENKSSDDVLPILLALNDLNPNHNESVVQQLGSADIEKRLVAYQLIQNRIERWNGPNPPPPSEIVALADSLQSMRSQIPESILLRGQLAARMLRIVHTEVPNASKLRTNIESMIASAAALSTPVLSTSSSPNAAISASMTPTGLIPTAMVSAKVRVATSPEPQTSTGSPPSNTSVSNSMAAMPVVRSRIGDLAPLDNPPSFSKPSVSRSSSDSAASWAVPKIESGSPLPFASTMTSSISLPQKVTVQSTPIRVAEPIPFSANQETVAPTIVAENDTGDSIRGIDKLEIDQLLQMLASTQHNRVQGASNELLHRGMTRPQLDIAIDLAQGNIEQRLTAMEQLVRVPGHEPIAIPLLAWMAENADIQVRRKAVALLGSMSNQDALRNLRMLKLRKPDGAIADQITQVLLASGTAINSLR